MTNLGQSALVTPDRIAQALVTLLSDEQRRRSMESAQRACVDGLGAARVADTLVSLASQL